MANLEERLKDLDVDVDSQSQAARAVQSNEDLRLLTRALCNEKVRALAQHLMDCNT